MPGLSQKSGHHIHTHSSSTSTSSCGGSATNAKDAIWSCSRDHVTYAQLYKFWSELPSSSRQELLRIDKQTLFEQVRKNLYCSRCNGLLLEVFSQIVLYGKNIHQEAAYAHALCGQPQNRNHIENGSKLMAASTQDDTSDPSVHPWGGLATTRDSVLTLLDCFLIGTSLEALQNVFDSGRARERERELLYPDACGGGGRGWISQGTSTSGRGHGMKETCALHTARLSCEALVDFWSALGEETRLSLLRLKEEDFIERLMFRFDSKRFCRDCRRNVLREFKELKELKRTRREPRCTTWFCVADTAFQYEVSDCTVQADWHECFAEAGGIYHHFEWAVGTGEGKSDILGFEDVGLSGSVQADGLELDNITACFITLRAWKHDGRCTELSVKAHALEGRLCVHRRLIVGDGFVTITKGESIRRFFEHAEETEEEEDEDSTDKEGNDLETEGLRPQKHAKSPELARDFLLDAATVIFKEQVEKAFREGTARQNAHSIFVCLALGLLEERVHVACKEIITLEKQKKLLEEEAAEKREEEERKERKRLKEREKKLRRKEKLKEKEREKEKNSVEVNPVVLISQKSANGSIPTEQEESACHSGDGAGNKNDDTVMARSSSPDMIMATSSMHYVLGENRNGKEHDMSFSVVYVDGEFNARDGNGSFIVGQSKSARRKSKIRKSPMLETASGRLFRRGPNMSLETHSHVRSSERPASHGYFETSGSIHSFQKHSKSLKPDNFGKADNRNSTTKCHEKYHWSNGRSHYRYDYQLCGCSTHSFDKSVRESRITDKSDATYDMPKPFYRIGSHMAGPILDHGVHKGKNSAGVLCGSRGDMVSHKKVWEPLELRRQANRSPSQCSVPLNSITSKAAACEKGDTFNRKIIQCSNKLNTMHNNNNNNNNNNVSVASISTNEWSPLSSCISNGSDKKSRISNSHHSESDATSEGLVQEIHNDSGQKTKSSLSVPPFNGNHINDSASCISAADDCCRQSRDNNGCIVIPSSHNISEKPKDTTVAGDSSSASENGCQYGDVKISNKCGTDLQVPCSNPGSIENFDRHRSGSQLGTACSPVLNHVDISKTTGLSAVQGSAMSATKGSFTTLEMTSQQQMLPVHLPSISSSMYPLHSQHNQSHNYYQSSGGWPPVTGSGLLPVTPPNRIVFPGPGGFGLSSGRLPGFSLPHPSFQPLPSLLAASQIPSSHGSASVSYNGLTSSRLGEPQIGEVRFCTGVNLVHQEAKNPPQKEVSNGLSSSEVTSPQQDGISGNSPTHDTSAFSLFHFGGPAGVTKESDLNSVPLQEEIPRDSTMKDACVAQLLQSDITTPNDQAPIEEYSLFAVSRGNRFAFF